MRSPIKFQDPRGSTEEGPKDRRGEIFSHVHRGLDEIASIETVLPAEFMTFSWVVEGGRTKKIDFGKLLTLTNLTDNELKKIIPIITVACIWGDRVAAEAALFFLLGKLSVAARNREDIISILGGSNRKVTENIAMTRQKKIAVGEEAEIESGDEEQEEE